MTLGLRKLIVLLLVAAVFLLANVWLVARWLQELGAVDLARYIRSEYLTPTAVTIIVVLLVLLVGTGRSVGFVRRCPVCDRLLLGGSKYCGECGSRV